MEDNSDFNIDEAIINKLGLQLSQRPINAPLAQHARVFEFPDLEDIYIMESDLYGNTMPKGTCFLAFNGRNGLVGKHLKLETLRNASIEDIKTLVQKNTQG
jgi:hypothetical protein